MGRHKEFDQQERLKKARDLFWKKGYNATSLHDLVTEMKLGRSSLYETYGDKHTLFLESLNDYAIETHAAYMQATAGITSPVKSIEAIIYKAIERSFEQDKVCMSVKSSFELSSSDRVVQKTLQVQVNNLVVIFEKLILAAQQKKEIETEKNAAQIALFVVASFAGFWQMQLLFNDKQMILDLAKNLIGSIS